MTVATTFTDVGAHNRFVQGELAGLFEYLMNGGIPGDVRASLKKYKVRPPRFMGEKRTSRGDFSRVLISRAVVELVYRTDLDDEFLARVTTLACEHLGPTLKASEHNSKLEFQAVTPHRIR